MSNWPKWHDVLFHTRPKRHRERLLAHLVLRDLVDPEEALWEISWVRPHKYYW